jgi:glyoxylase-like metal-dependent hydrolase (beta-lactamase superfamily II)
MKIIPLKRNNSRYSCTSYLVLGDWNRLDDINTIIDPGSDASVLDEIRRISTGFGKAPVEQVILTHNHFDHNGAVPALKEHFNARVLAFTGGPDVDELLRHGQTIGAGDGMLEVIHTPGHSSDSICLYASSERALFSGDTQVRVERSGETYLGGYVEALFTLASRDITTIYLGHGEPITADCRELIDRTLRNVCRSTVLEDNARIS